VATARDQDYLKLQSGARLSGRPCEEPVMTISLSWHPSEKPGKQQMIEAADSYLNHLVSVPDRRSVTLTCHCCAPRYSAVSPDSTLHLPQG
jgi:hypothetical protein